VSFSSPPASCWRCWRRHSRGGGADSDPNKCHTEWDFCNAGSEAENAYHWRLGWCVAAVERGAVSVSVSACMGREEGSVSYPRSSSSSPSSSPAAADDNKCYTEWDFCSSGTEAENAYHWRLGWCTSAAERGAMSLSVDQCMGEGAAPAASSPPEETTEPENYCTFTDWVFGSGWICRRFVQTPYHWTATLPPGMICKTRDESWPFHCLEHSLPHPLDQTLTAAVGG